MPARPDPALAMLIEQYLVTVQQAKTNVVTKDSQALLGACILAAVHVAQNREMPTVPVKPITNPERTKQRDTTGHPAAKHFTAPTGRKPKAPEPTNEPTAPMG
jgi:hypothetical protein